MLSKPTHNSFLYGEVCVSLFFPSAGQCCDMLTTAHPPTPPPSSRCGTMSYQEGDTACCLQNELQYGQRVQLKVEPADTEYPNSLHYTGRFFVPGLCAVSTLRSALQLWAKHKTFLKKIFYIFKIIRYRAVIIILT